MKLVYRDLISFFVAAFLVHLLTAFGPKLHIERTVYRASRADTHTTEKFTVAVSSGHFQLVEVLMYAALATVGYMVTVNMERQTRTFSRRLSRLRRRRAFGEPYLQLLYYLLSDAATACVRFVWVMPWLCQFGLAMCENWVDFKKYLNVVMEHGMDAVNLHGLYYVGCNLMQFTTLFIGLHGVYRCLLPQRTARIYPMHPAQRR